MQRSEKAAKGDEGQCPYCPHTPCECGWCHCRGLYHGIGVVEKQRQARSDEELKVIDEKHEGDIAVEFGYTKEKIQELKEGR